MLKDKFFKSWILPVSSACASAILGVVAASGQFQKLGTGSAHSSVILVQVDPWCRPPLNPLTLVRIKMTKGSLAVGSWFQPYKFYFAGRIAFSILSQLIVSSILIFVFHRGEKQWVTEMCLLSGQSIFTVHLHPSLQLRLSETCRERITTALGCSMSFFLFETHAWW